MPQASLTKSDKGGRERGTQFDLIGHWTFPPVRVADSTDACYRTSGVACRTIGALRATPRAAGFVASGAVQSAAVVGDAPERMFRLNVLCEANWCCTEASPVYAVGHDDHLMPAHRIAR